MDKLGMDAKIGSPQDFAAFIKRRNAALDRDRQFHRRETPMSDGTRTRSSSLAAASADLPLGWRCSSAARRRGLRAGAGAQGGRRRHPDQLQRHPRALRARTGRSAEARASAAVAPGDPALDDRRDLELVRPRRRPPRSATARRTSCCTGATCTACSPMPCARSSPTRSSSAARCASVRPRATAEVTFESGDTIRARLRDRRRRHSFQGARRAVRCRQPEFTGCVAWRGLVPMEKLPEQLAQMQGTNWLGPRGHVLHYPVRRGEIMNFIASSSATTGRSNPG